MLREPGRDRHPSVEMPNWLLCENRKAIAMFVLRSTFIALSRNLALRGFSESSSIGRRMSSRFVAGLEVDDVLRAAESVNSQGISATLDSLGENVATPDEARHSADVYHRLLDDIKSRGLNANVSVKLTQMGLELDPELTEEIAANLVAHAVETDNFVRIDMEGSALTQVTLSIPVIDGRLALGTWQAIYLFEHRRRPHERRIALHMLGD